MTIRAQPCLPTASAQPTGHGTRFFSLLFCSAVFGWLFTASSAHAANPAVLIVTDGVIDYTLLKAWHDAGYEVDYRADWVSITSDYLKNFNVLFIGAGSRGPVDPAVPAINDFLNNGGGVFAMAFTNGTDGGVGPDPAWLPLINQPGNSWGVRIRGEAYREGDSSRSGVFPHIDLGADMIDVNPSPVSAGVSHIWLPIGNYKDGTFTNPLYFSDPAWQIVAQAPATAFTVPITYGGTPGDMIQDPKGITAPPLIGIRQFGKGRILFCSTFDRPTFSAATQFYYTNAADLSAPATYASSVVLQAGMKGIPSDFGKLMFNALSWLAAPSLNQGVLGGHVTDPIFFVPPWERPGATNQFLEFLRPSGIPTPSSQMTRFETSTDYRGLLGAQTQYSGGQGTVADYAAAAQAAGLAFVAFMEDYSAMTPAKLAALAADCLAQSTTSLMLIPGYTIDTNIGSHLFVVGHHTTAPTLPPASQITADGLLGIQAGVDGVTSSFVWDWILQYQDTQSAGYYHFSDNTTSPRYYDVRIASLGAVRYYENGKLIEDVTPDYITAAGSTMPLYPVVVNRVRSPAELLQAVQNNESLIYTRARDVMTAVDYTFQWHGTEGGYPNYVSDGPHVISWGNVDNFTTYANNPFASGRNLVVQDLHVTSAVGLKDLLIYNGNTLYRRYLANGATDFEKILEFSRTIQSTMVLVAHDVNGGVAVSNPLRFAGASVATLAFCSDFSNDCGFPYWLSRGPGYMSLYYPLPVNEGPTWDGGPRGINDPSGGFHMDLRVKSNLGIEDTYANIPLLSLTDPMVLRLRNILDRKYSSGVATFGPLVPTDQASYVRNLTAWAPSRVVPEGFTELFEEDVNFKQTLTPTSLELGWASYTPPNNTLFMLRQPDGTWQTSDMSPVPGSASIAIPTGAWFGYYNERPLVNNVLLLNLGDPIHMDITKDATRTTSVIFGAVEGKTFTAADALHYKVFSIANALGVSHAGIASFDAAIKYLANPEGLKVLRGQPNPKTLPVYEIAADSGAVEIQVPRPSKTLNFGLAFRVTGLNPNWSVGYFQRSGYNDAFYGNGNGQNVYTDLGTDELGRAYASLYPDEADMTDVVVGNPVVCDNPAVEIAALPRTEGTPTSDLTYYSYALTTSTSIPAWDVAINNPTDSAIVTTCRQNMNPPGFYFPPQVVQLPVGQAVTVWDGLRPPGAPPVIFDVGVSGVSNGMATIHWQTDEAADSQVDLGLSASYGKSVPINGTPVTVHQATTFPLEANTLYHYRVGSRDAGSLLSLSSDYTFQFGTSQGAIASPNPFNVRVYPNPWRADRHAAATVTFDQLPLGATIKIFSVSGHLVRTLNPASSSTPWDLLNDSGQKVASGIYLFGISDSLGHHAVGKLAIVR